MSKARAYSTRFVSVLIACLLATILLSSCGGLSGIVQDALAGFAGRYFVDYGPGTLDVFARTGSTVSAMVDDPSRGTFSGIAQVSGQDQFRIEARKVGDLGSRVTVNGRFVQDGGDASVRADLSGAVTAASVEAPRTKTANTPPFRGPYFGTWVVTQGPYKGEGGSIRATVGSNSVAKIGVIVDGVEYGGEGKINVQNAQRASISGLKAVVQFTGPVTTTFNGNVTVNADSTVTAVGNWSNDQGDAGTWRAEKITAG